MPESPIWLRSKNRYEEAVKATEWLKLPSLPPFSEVKKSMELNATNGDGGDGNGYDSGRTMTSSFFVRPVMMPLAIGLTLLVLQQISGIDAIIFFTVEIFRAAGK